MSDLKTALKNFFRGPEEAIEADLAECAKGRHVEVVTVNPRKRRCDFCGDVWYVPEVSDG